MIVNRILIKFETASFEIIPDINPKSFQNLLLLPARNESQVFPIRKSKLPAPFSIFQTNLSLSLLPENPPETVFSRIFPRDGVEWIFRWKIRETLELSSRRRYRLTRTRLRIEKFSRHRQSGKKLCRMKTGFVWKRGSPSWKESDGSMGAHSPCSLKRNF